MRTSIRSLAAGVLVTASASAWCQGWLGGDAGGRAGAPAVSAEATAFSQGQEDWAQPFMLALYRDGEWGAVLNLDRLGLAAMERQRFPLARKAFDEAITRVEAIYASDANAVKARSTFNEEKIKDFKGEPYERSMLYYYRGLLYVEEGDYQNARASFLAADRHDTLSSAEDAAYTGNFGLMKYLAGWASQCEGDTARTAQLVGEARSADPKMSNLPQQPAPSIVLIDSGAGPVKWGDGKYKEALKFRPGDGEDPVVALKTRDGEDVSATAVVAGDVNFQATTRGGREVDAIMAGKAKFKDNANTVSEVSMQAGSQLALIGSLSGNRDIAGAGLFGLFAGLVAKGIEQAATPAADVRHWDSLPGRILLVSAADVARDPLVLDVGGTARPMPLQVARGSCTMAWGRTRSALTADRGGTVRFDDSPPLEANRGDRNKAFRAMLVADMVAAK